MESREIKRQAIHIFLGLAVMLMYLVLGREISTVIVFGTVLLGFLAINQIKLGRKIPIFSLFVEKFEREDVEIPGYGSAWYALGVLLILVSLGGRTNETLGALLLLCVSDGLATIFPLLLKQKHRLPFTDKSWEGWIGYVVGSLPGFFIFPVEYWAPLVLITSIVEVYSVIIDDNILIPLVSTIYFIITR